MQHNKNKNMNSGVFFVNLAFISKIKDIRINIDASLISDEKRY
jgi:hypothetical protein